MAVSGVRRFVRTYPEVHIGIGLFGSTAFVIGSVLFLLHVRTPASWLFVLGSTGMLIGRVGEVLARYERHRLRR
jgi:hypothetical protein